MTRNKLARFILIIFFLLGTCINYGQTSDNILGTVNIASPNAASLGKFGDVPVSYHTGVPDINVPLYVMQEGNLSVPINLSYHSGGLKVDEHASNVGAGWALNSGGVITRTVRDKPDERMTSSLNQQYGYFSDYGLATYWYNANVSQNPTGVLPEMYFDSEPDLFFFNFNGYSGKFYFNDDRTPMLVPEQDLKIEYVYPGDANPGALWASTPGVWAMAYCIMAFKITTPDGTQYFFGAYDPVIAPYCDPVEVNNSLGFFTDELVSGYWTSYNTTITSWYLQKIVSSDGGTVINFSYTRDKFATYTFSNPPKEPNSSGGHDYTLVKNLTAGVFLSKIQGANIVVDFIPGIIRQDVSSWNVPALDESIIDNPNTKSRSLGGINISNSASKCIKKYMFYQDYFTDDVTPAVSYFSGITYDKKRLRLNAIVESSCDEVTKKPPYIFEYYGEQVPRMMSFSRDHWGYNNGITTNQNLYPKMTYTSIGTPVNNGAVANRKAIWPAMRAGALKKITYPTGGSAQLDFEPHTFTITQNNISADSIVGGLRIKTISNFDPITNKTLTTNYSYLADGSNYSSGVLYSKPTYIQIFRNDMLMKTYYFDYYSNYTGCPDVEDPYTSTYSRAYVFSDNPVRPMETTQGSHIGYSRVQVSQPNNGYSVYKFFVTPPWQVAHDALAITKIDVYSPCLLSIPNYPPAPLPTDYVRGELGYEGHFDEGGKLLTDKTYLYEFTENPTTTPGRVYRTMNQYTAETWYELKTAKKTKVTVQENTYQTDGTTLTNQVQTLFGSNFHHQPSETIATSSDGKTIDRKTKYIFDYSIDNTPACSFGSSSFMGFLNATYLNHGFQNSFLQTGGGSYLTKWASVMDSFYDLLFVDRYNYVNCRKTNYTNTNPLNQFQVNHNSAKSSANSELGAILWAQDVYINAPVEKTEWVNNKLTSSTYTQYINTTGDSYGVYPLKTMKLDLASPSSTFTSSAVSGSTIVRDTRYKDDVLVTFSGGRLINLVERNGLPIAYQWGYNNGFPTAKVTNAMNSTIKEFFYEGFEENASPDVVTGGGHSGKKYWGGSAQFTPTFAVPNSRTYRIQWWSLVGTKWILNDQPYTGTIALSGAVDDVRIFPMDAQVSTYTYEPGLGITSQTDPAGLKMSYSYDNLARLSFVSDDQGNILKSYAYNYFNNPANPPLPVPPPPPVISSVSNSFLIGPSGNPSQQTPLMLFPTVAGTVTISIPQPGLNVQVNCTYTLTGPGNFYKVGSLCATSTSMQPCGDLVVQIPNVPTGTYTLTYSSNTNSGVTFQSSITATYLTQGN